MKHFNSGFIPKFILLCVFAVFIKANGSHMMGADMQYKCLGNGMYKITAKLYRDCRGIPLNGPTFGVFAGNNGGNSCGNYSLIFNRISIRDVTPICDSLSAPCNPQNTTSKEGVEEHIYEAIVNFKTTPLSNFWNNSSCCNVTFYVGQCCRNGAITTGPAGNDFYTTCLINLCSLDSTQCNSSPSLTNIPIIFHCCNTPYRYNIGALDSAENDSLSYKLVGGIGSLPNASVTYTNPFSFDHPLSVYCPGGGITCTPNPNATIPEGFFLDSANGDMVFTPVKCDEVGIIVVEITEWRNVSGTWKMLGKNRRDIQVLFKDCGNNMPPQISGQKTHRMCEGDSICFDILAIDRNDTSSTSGDTVTLDWNNGIPGASFTIKNPQSKDKEARFCWVAPIGSSRANAYTFTAHTVDRNCPIKSESYVGFKIYVDQCNTGTNKLSGKTAIRIYPMPVSSGNFIQLQPEYSGKYEILSISGQIIYHGRAEITKGIWVPSEVKSGIYSIQMESGPRFKIVVD
ncbi:MAG: hypothetical protein KG003_06745 [Bacteroidetes bacterium]|nr:hypothetical protein [Bacteroidota bacterium]